MPPGRRPVAGQTALRRLRLRADGAGEEGPGPRPNASAGSSGGRAAPMGRSGAHPL